MSYLYNVNKGLVSGLILAVLGIMILGFTQIAFAQERGSGHQQYRDARYQHNHDYPARGQFIGSLPRGHREVSYHNVKIPLSRRCLVSSAGAAFSHRSASDRPFHSFFTSFLYNDLVWRHTLLLC